MNRTFRTPPSPLEPGTAALAHLVVVLLVLCLPVLARSQTPARPAIALQGTVLGNRAVASPSDCQAACQATPGCTGYSFRMPVAGTAPKTNCSLLGGSLTELAVGGVVSCRMPCGATSPTPVLKSAVPTTASGDLRMAAPSMAAVVAPLAAAKPAAAPASATPSPTRPKSAKTRRARGETSGDDDLDDLEVERVTGARRAARP